MDPAMDISDMRVALRGAAKIFKAGLQSKTWDIHGMPQFITTTHCEGCNTREAYALHVVEALKVAMVEIPPREVKKAFHTAWLNIVCHIEDEASLESDKKVEWYSNHCNNLMDNLRLAEEKASTEWDHHQNADKKLVQANSKIAELEGKLVMMSMDAEPNTYPILIPPASNTFYFCHHPQPHHSQPYHTQSIIYHPSFVINGYS